MSRQPTKQSVVQGHLEEILNSGEAAERMKALPLQVLLIFSNVGKSLMSGSDGTNEQRARVAQIVRFADAELERRSGR